MVERVQYEYVEEEGVEDMEYRSEELEKIVKSRKKRMIMGSLLLSLSLLFMQLAILILIGILGLSPIVAVALILSAPVFLAIGLYLLVFLPPVVLEE
jgi:hypothetical protein